MATYNQIGYGSKGSDVTELQKLLNQNGYTLDTDGIFGSNTLAAVKDYQQKNNLSVDGIVGSNTWGALTKANTSDTAGGTSPEETAPTVDPSLYTPSDTVTQAETLLQQHLANKPGEYQSPWQDQLNDLFDRISNREDFSYDLNGDALYQQYKDQYTTQGQMAMMDTMGQAAALTGGYGNSYAQSVGQQTYQGYLQGLNDKIPELYQLALSQYNAEGDEMYNQFALMSGLEEQEYGRHRDTVSDFYTELGRLTDAYNTERDYDYSQWYNNLMYQYQTGRDEVADQQWQAQFDEAKRQFDLQYSKSSSGGGGGSGGSGGGGGGGSDNSGGSGGSGAYEGAVATAEAAKKFATKQYYADWDGGDWEAYFASIRQSEGRAAAEAELEYFTSNGFIPTKYVSMAAIGVRGGSMGH